MYSERVCVCESVFMCVRVCVCDRGKSMCVNERERESTVFTRIVAAASVCDQHEIYVGHTVVCIHTWKM